MHRDPLLPFFRPDRHTDNENRFGGGRPASVGDQSGQSAGSNGYQEWDPRHPTRMAERARRECRQLRHQWRLDVEKAEVAELRLKWADKRAADADADAEADALARARR